MSTKSKILSLLGVVGLIGLITAYVFEFRWMENTFEVRKLVWGSVVTGIFLGTLVTWRWQKNVDDSVAKMQLWAACLLLPAMFAPLFGSLANRLLSTRPAQIEEFIFHEEKAFAASPFGFFKGEKIAPDGYYIFFNRNGKLERIESDRPRFEDIERGTTIELPVKKGLFGFEFVKFDE